MTTQDISIHEEKHTMVLESYGRRCTSSGFFDDFYSIFINSSPEVAPMFANTDMVKQKQLLRTGISMVIQYFAGSAAGKMGIETLTKSHDREHLNIEGHLYPFWADSLIKTIRRHDAKFDSEMEAIWREVIQKTINTFVEAY